MSSNSEVNEEIVNGDVVLFLGAGASQPLGRYPTAQFLDLLEQELPNRINEDKGSAPSPPNFGTLFSQAARHYKVDPPDSEIVLDYLDYLRKACEQLHDIPEEFRRLAGTAGAGGYHKESGDMLSFVRGHIEESVIQHYSAVDGTQALRVYRSLMDVVFARRHVLPIFTTNYDWTFENLITAAPDQYRLTDGFREMSLGLRWSRDAFTEFSPDDQVSHIALFKLHGSTNWSLVQGETSRPKS